MLVSLELESAPCSIVVSDEGSVKVILVILLQPPNALSPIVVTDPGIVTLVTIGLPARKFSPTAVTGSP